MISVDQCSKELEQNRLREGDSPILLRRLRKIGTVPAGFVRVPKTLPKHLLRALCVSVVKN